MSPTPFDIQREPKVKRAISAQVRHTTGSLLCRTCQAPATSTGFCRYHYYMEAADGRGKQYSSLGHRPGKWLPPLIVVATIFLACAFIGVLALFFCFLCPLFMVSTVFGTKASGRYKGVPPQPSQRSAAPTWAPRPDFQGQQQAFYHRIEGMEADARYQHQVNQVHQQARFDSQPRLGRSDWD